MSRRMRWLGRLLGMAALIGGVGYVTAYAGWEGELRGALARRDLAALRRVLPRLHWTRVRGEGATRALAEAVRQ
jgi:hypothetical protein